MDYIKSVYAEQKADFIIGGLKRHACLGLKTRKIHFDVQNGNESYKYGFEVVSIIDNCSANKEDFQIKDIIIKINDCILDSVNSISEILTICSEKETIELLIYREKRFFINNILLQPKPLEKSEEIDILYSSFNSNGRKLRLIMTKPICKTNIKYPAVLFLQGIDCISVDFPFSNNHPYKKILYQLTKGGFVTIRIEKSGIGDSEGIPCKDIDFFTEVEDFNLALNFVNSIDFIEKGNLFLFGYSIGGIIAPILAKSDTVKGIIVFGTVTRNYCDYIFGAIKRQKKLKGIHDDDIEKYIEKIKLLFDLLFIKRHYPQEIYKMNSDFQMLLLDGKYLYNRHYKYFQQLIDIQIMDLWKEINKPVLIIAGKADYVADFYDHQLLYDTLKKRNPIGVVNFMQPEIDHAFHKVYSMKESIEGYYEKEYCFETVENIIKWLLENT